MDTAIMDETTTSRTQDLARAISLVGHPFLVAPCALYVLLWLDQKDPWIAARWTLLCAGMVLAPALLYLRRKLVRKEFTDADVSVREHRFGFYLFGGSCMLACAAVLILLHAPRLLLAGMVTSLFALGMAVFLNRYWTKVSIHAGTLSGIAAALATFDWRLSMPVLLLALLVSWSRIRLGRHSAVQLLAGVLLGLISVALLFHP